MVSHLNVAGVEDSPGNGDAGACPAPKLPILPLVLLCLLRVEVLDQPGGEVRKQRLNKACPAPKPGACPAPSSPTNKD